MLRSLSKECGVTILADPAQAIYGFTTDENDVETAQITLLNQLETESPRKLKLRKLNEIHRIKNKDLINVFHRTRKEVENQREHNSYIVSDRKLHFRLNSDRILLPDS